MLSQKFIFVVLTTAFMTGGSGYATANCDAEIVKLDEAMKVTSLSADTKVGLRRAKQAATAASTSGDSACGKVVADAMRSAGLAAPGERAASKPPASVAATDLSELRGVAADCLSLVNVGKLSPARRQAKYLEAAWDQVESQLRSRGSERAEVLDHAIARAVSTLRSRKPDAAASHEALTSLLAAIDAAK